MHKCYEYQTPIGPFYIVEQQGRYHAIYSDISIGSCIHANEVAAVLGYGYKFTKPGMDSSEIDTSKLGIPTDLSNWISCYFVPNSIKGSFEHPSLMKPQNMA